MIFAKIDGAKITMLVDGTLNDIMKETCVFVTAVVDQVNEKNDQYTREQLFDHIIENLKNIKKEGYTHE